jgi:hypothetical protein
MTIMKKMLAGGAGLAALAAAAPAAAQYAYPYGYSSPYANPYGYTGYNGYGAYGINTNAAAQRCSAAVQSRLANRTTIADVLGSIVGLPTNSYGRVVSITSVTPRNNSVRVRGLASSGRYASNGYGPYGVGAYGALGYNYQPDLSFSCSVDYRGYVRDVDLTRRY